MEQSDGYETRVSPDGRACGTVVGVRCKSGSRGWDGNMFDAGRQVWSGSPPTHLYRKPVWPRGHLKSTPCLVFPYPRHCPLHRGSPKLSHPVSNASAPKLGASVSPGADKSTSLSMQRLASERHCNTIVAAPSRSRVPSAHPNWVRGWETGELTADEAFHGQERGRQTTPAG